MPSSQETFSRFSLLKKFLKNKQADIVLFTGVILVALIGFGLGHLLAPEQQCEPLIIEDKTETDLSSQLLPATASVLQQTEDYSNPTQGMFVASRNSNKYHWPHCPYAQKIKPSNLIGFDSEAQAKQSGYSRCSKFPELSPANYKP